MCLQPPTSVYYIYSPISSTSVASSGTHTPGNVYDTHFFLSLFTLSLTCRAQDMTADLKPIWDGLSKPTKLKVSPPPQQQQQAPSTHSRSDGDEEVAGRRVDDKVAINEANAGQRRSNVVVVSYFTFVVCK